MKRKKAKAKPAAVSLPLIATDPAAAQRAEVDEKLGRVLELLRSSQREALLSFARAELYSTASQAFGGAMSPESYNLKRCFLTLLCHAETTCSVMEQARKALKP